MTTGVSMDFVAHLLAREWISEAQALDALDLQRKSRATLGQMALRLKLLTVKQLFEVMRVQMESRQQFDAIAVNLGYLTQEETDEVLTAQRTETTSIATILMQSGALSAAQLDAAQRDFAQEPSHAPAPSAPSSQRGRLASCNDARRPEQPCKPA